MLCARRQTMHDLFRTWSKSYYTAIILLVFSSIHPAVAQKSTYSSFPTLGARHISAASATHKSVLDSMVSGSKHLPRAISPRDPTYISIRDSGQNPGRLPPAQINFYYIGIGFFVIFLGVCLLLFHIRRRRRKLLESRYAGQDALARDIDGLPYPNNRHWVASGRRGEGGMFTTRGDEGLDERGEAPPPYKPAGRARGPGPGANEEPAYAEGSAGAGVAIPLQTFHGTEPYSKPPDYEERSRQDLEAQTQPRGEQGSLEPGSDDLTRPGPLAARPIFR